MSLNQRERIRRALRGALRPLANALMSIGFTYRDFAEVAKESFVSVAHDNYGNGSRPASASRISAKTGLTRTNVKQIRDRFAEEPIYSFEDSLLPAQIINRWFSDPTYLDKNGKPVALPFIGNDPSFISLLATFDVTTGTDQLLNELLVSGTVIRQENGMLKPSVPYYRPLAREAQLERALAQPICALLTAIDRNLSVDRSDAWIERFAFVKTADTDGLTRIRQFAKERSRSFIVSSNDLFTALESNEEEASQADAKSVGVCAFYFEQEPDARFDVSSSSETH